MNYERALSDCMFFYSLIRFTLIMLHNKKQKITHLFSSVFASNNYIKKKPA